MKKKTLETLRLELGVTPPTGRAKGIPTYLIHLAFRLNEREAITLIKAAQGKGISESLLARQILLEHLRQELPEGS